MEDAGAIENIIHIGPARAVEMIELRPFDNVKDMLRINGITEGRLSEIESEGLACVVG